MLCMLIYFQKRNMFEDSHGKLAGTLKSPLNVVHVDLLILNFSLGRVELISQIHKYPKPNFIIIIINGGNMPVTKTHLTY